MRCPSIVVGRSRDCSQPTVGVRCSAHGSEAGQDAHAHRRAIDGQSYHAPRRAILHADPIADCGRNPRVCSASNTCKHRYDRRTHYPFTSNELRFAAPWKPINSFGVVLRRQWPLTLTLEAWAGPGQRRGVPGIVLDGYVGAGMDEQIEHLHVTVCRRFMQWRVAAARAHRSVTLAHSRAHRGGATAPREVTYLPTQHCPWRARSPSHPTGARRSRRGR